MIKRCLCFMLRKIPTGIFQNIKLIKYIYRFVDVKSIEEDRIKRFGIKLLENFNDEVKKIVKKKRVMIIKEGAYEYLYFNAAFLNNMVSLILYSLYRGYIPVININSEEKTSHQWDWFFKQPKDTVFVNVDITEFKQVICDVKDCFGPSFEMVFNHKERDFQICNLLYQRFVVLNDHTKKYIEDELKIIKTTGNTLGVIIRGTDYVKLEPKGHPRQPNISELIDCIHVEMKRKTYKNIYVATEEKNLFDALENEFGKESLISNKRVYYDEIYSQNEYEYINEIHFERENDEYLKGLEYLSSLFILSRCDGFVGSNCGGTIVALLMTKKHDNVHVINKGYY